MSETVTAAQMPTRGQTIWVALNWFDRRRLFLLVLIAGGVVYSQSRFWSQTSRSDRANWDYFAQVIVRGGVPYRDVVNIKTPLSAYIGAAAILVTKPFGFSDVLSIRVTFILLAVLTAGFTFLVALDYSGSRRVALLAASVMLSFSTFASYNGGGIQPKTPMVLFGLVSLLAVLNDRPFIAGAFGMLSALCWQPGLLFVGAAGLAFSQYLTSWRDMKAIKMIAGATLPLAILVTYFWAAGALRDFYLWTIHFNATVYGPNESRSLGNFFNHFSTLLNGPYQNSVMYFYLALAGICISIGLATARLVKRGRRDDIVNPAARHSVVIAPLAYFAFCMIDIQGGPDLIPLVPFVAIFAAAALAYAIEQATGLFTRVWRTTPRAAVENWASVALVVLISISSITRAFFFEDRSRTLKDQQSAVAELVSHLEPGDKIFVYGATQVLVLSGLTNASKYFLLDRGKDLYLDQVEPGGFGGWLQRLKAERPKIVVLYRLTKSDRTKYLEDWVAADYQMRSNRIFTYYIRNDSSG